MDVSYGRDLLYIRSHMDEEMPLVEQNPEQTKRSGFLYGLLASLLKQRPLMLLKGIEQGNGLEAVRQLSNMPTFFKEQVLGSTSPDHAMAKFRHEERIVATGGEA